MMISHGSQREHFTGVYSPTAQSKKTQVLSDKLRNQPQIRSASKEMMASPVMLSPSQGVTPRRSQHAN